MPIRITPALSIQEHEIVERFVRASGPGGQNVNKVATAVQLRFSVGRSSLPDEIKDRLRALAGTRLTTTDLVVVEAREHRTQAQNREAARERLVALLRQAAKRPRPRRRTRPTLASRERRLEGKRQHGEQKRARANRNAED